LAISLIGLPPLVEWLKVPVLLAQAVIIVITPLINYPINKYWTFRARPTPEPAETLRSTERTETD
jgi:putative flippase GtrA